MTRLRLLLDDGEYKRYDTDLTSGDPLGFVDSKPYSERCSGMQEATDLSDALIVPPPERWRPARPDLRHGIRFIGGSMGCVVGEKIARAIERSHRRTRSR